MNNTIPQIDKKVNIGQNANCLNNYAESALDSIKAEELTKSQGVKSDKSKIKKQ